MTDDLKIKIDSKEAKRALESLEKSLKDVKKKIGLLGKQKMSIKVGADTAEAKRKIKALENQTVKVNVDAKVKGLQKQIQDMEKKFSKENAIAKKLSNPSDKLKNNQIQKESEKLGKRANVLSRQQIAETEKSLKARKQQTKGIIESHQNSVKNILKSKRDMAEQARLRTLRNKAEAELNNQLKRKAIANTGVARAYNAQTPGMTGGKGRQQGLPMDNAAFNRFQNQKKITTAQSVKEGKELKKAQKNFAEASDNYNRAVKTVEKAGQKEYDKLFDARPTTSVTSKKIDTEERVNKKEMYKKLWDKSDAAMSKSERKKEYDLFKKQDIERARSSFISDVDSVSDKRQLPIGQRPSSILDKSTMPGQQETIIDQKKRKLNEQYNWSEYNKGARETNKLFKEREGMFQGLGDARNKMMKQEKSLNAEHKLAQKTIEKEIVAQEESTGKRMSNYDKDAYRKTQMEEYKNTPEMKQYAKDLNDSKKAYEGLNQKSQEFRRSMGNEIVDRNKQVKDLSAFQKEHKKIYGVENKSAAAATKIHEKKIGQLRDELSQHGRINKISKQTEMSASKILETEKKKSNLLQKNAKGTGYTASSYKTASQGLRDDDPKKAPRRRSKYSTPFRSGTSDTIQQLPQNKLLGRFAQGGMMASGMAASLFLVQMISAQVMNLMNVITSWQDSLSGLVDNLDLTSDQLADMPDAIRGYSRGLGVSGAQATAATEATMQYGMAPTSENVGQMYALNYSDKVGGYEDAALIMRLGEEFGGIMNQYMKKWESYSGKGESSGSLGYEWGNLKSSGSDAMQEVWGRNGTGLTDSMHEISSWIKNNRKDIADWADIFGSAIAGVGKVAMAAAPAVTLFLGSWAAFHGGKMIIDAMSAISKSMIAVKATTMNATASFSKFKTILSGIAPAIGLMVAAWAAWELGTKLHDLYKLKQELKEIGTLSNQDFVNMSSGDIDQGLSDTKGTKAHTEERIKELKKIESLRDKISKNSFLKYNANVKMALSGRDKVMNLFGFETESQEMDTLTEKLKEIDKQIGKFESAKGKKIFGDGFVIPEAIASWKEFTIILESVNKQFGVMPEMLAKIQSEQLKMQKEKDIAVGGLGFGSLKERIGQTNLKKVSDKEFGLSYEKEKAGSVTYGNAMTTTEGKIYDLEIEKNKAIKELQAIQGAGIGNISQTTSELDAVITAVNTSIEGLKIDSVTEEFLKLNTTLRNLNNSNALIGKTGLQGELAKNEMNSKRNKGKGSEVASAIMEKYALKTQDAFKKAIVDGSYYDKRISDQQQIAYSSSGNQNAADYNIADLQYRKRIDQINGKYNTSLADGTKDKKRILFNKVQEEERARVEKDLVQNTIIVNEAFKGLTNEIYNVEKANEIAAKNPQLKLFVEQMNALNKKTPGQTVASLTGQTNQKNINSGKATLNNKQATNDEIRKLYGKLKGQSGTNASLGYDSDLTLQTQRQIDFQKEKQKAGTSMSDDAINSKINAQYLQTNISGIEGYLSNIEKVRSAFPGLTAAQNDFLLAAEDSATKKLYEAEAALLKDAITPEKIKQSKITQDQVDLQQKLIDLKNIQYDAEQKIREANAMDSVIGNFNEYSGMMTGNQLTNSINSFATSTGISSDSDAYKKYEKTQQVSQKQGQISFLENLDANGMKDFSNQIKEAYTSLGELKMGMVSVQELEKLFPDATTEQIEEMTAGLQDIIDKQTLLAEIANGDSTAKGMWAGIEENLGGQAKPAGKTGMEMGKALSEGFNGALSGTLSAVFKGETDSIKEIWKNMADGIIDTMSDMLADEVLQAVLGMMSGGDENGGSGNTGLGKSGQAKTKTNWGGMIVGLIGSLFGGMFSNTGSQAGTISSNKAGTVWHAANGYAFNSGIVHKYAKGGMFGDDIYDKPTRFKFGNGGAIGELGEAGPEGILPLSRMRTGELGVSVAGAMSQTQASQEPPVVNMKNINVLDKSVVGDYLNTDEGEELLINLMQQNKNAIS